MAAIRLTKDTRYILVSRIIEHGFSEAGTALLKEEYDLGLEVYNYAHPEKYRKLMAQFPAGYFGTDDDIYLHVDGEYHKLAFGKRLPFPASRGQSKTEVSITSGEPLGSRVLDFVRRKTKHFEERKTAHSAAYGVVNSVDTLQKLLEVWPEITEFAKDILAKEKAVTSLAVPIKNLNDMLKLPPGATSAKKVKARAEVR